MDTFTMHRWATSPFQMYPLSFLVAVAIAQIQLGVSPASVQADLERHTVVAMAICNVFGASIALYGLHLRELESALWVEFWSYLCLIFVLGTYVGLLAQHTITANATIGFGFAEAFVFASVHRGVQILLYKRARFKQSKLAQRAVIMQETLSSILPSTPVEGSDPS